MEHPVIRPANPDDLPGVLALYRHLNAADPALDPGEAAPAWSALLSSGLTTVFVADLAGMLVSSCTLAIVPNLSRGACPYAVIENVVTHAGHRQQGLARAVLKAAIDTAWRAGCYKVTLTTGRKDDATLAFYEGVGFTRGGKTYFEMRRT